MNRLIQYREIVPFTSVCIALYGIDWAYCSVHPFLGCIVASIIGAIVWATWSRKSLVMQLVVFAVITALVALFPPLGFLVAIVGLARLVGVFKMILQHGPTLIIGFWLYFILLFCPSWLRHMGPFVLMEPYAPWLNSLAMICIGGGLMWLALSFAMRDGLSLAKVSAFLIGTPALVILLLLAVFPVHGSGTDGGAGGDLDYY